MRINPLRKQVLFYHDPLTVIWQYLVLRYLVKYLVFAGAACLFSFVFTVFKSNVTSAVLAGILPLIVCWLLYTLLPGNFVLNHVKYINPFYYLDSVKLFGEYQNLNFFTLPVNVRAILPVYLGIVWALLSGGAVLRFVSDRTVARQSLWERIRERLLKGRGKRYKSASLFAEEGYKFFVQEKAALLLAALLVGSLYLVSQNAAITFREEEQVYRKNMHHLSGSLTEEKQNYYDKLEAEYTEAERNGRNDYRLAGFKLVQQDYAYMQELAERNIEPAFTDQLSAKIWLSADGAEIKNALIFMAAVVLLVSALYGSDIKRNMLPLLKSTPGGRKRLARVKSIWALLAVLLIYAAVYLPFYLYIYRNIGDLPLSASLQSYQRYSQVGISGTIGGLLAVKLLLELLNGFTAAALVMYLMLRFRNRVTGILAALAVSCLPLALQSKGLELRWYSLNHAFLLGTTLEQGDVVGRLLLQEGIILGLSIVCLTEVRRMLGTKHKKEA